MIERLLTKPYPIKIRLKKDLPFIQEYVFERTPDVIILKAGEIGTYARHGGRGGDCYVFTQEKTISAIPNFSRTVLARLDDWVEVVEAAG